MHPQDRNEVKVKVATRQQTLPNDAAMFGGLILLVLLSVVVLIGRSAGGM
ncbi:hypothetical protein GCM10011309_25620 [Litorimonas cladophorae]|uniref:Uncharacterized protein n=2 Tax=Litorimonas cladophorae TaxID=1220491 RepID=A0A918KUK9_9PROT|nr:hypothetical protein GCM10011309_25620 [Litorimonas cladophorae]